RKEHAMSHRRWGVRGVVLCGVLFAGLCWAAEPAKIERRVTVQGHGKISAPPDQALIRVEVSEEGTRVDAVTQKVREKIDAVLKTGRVQGIPDKDVQTQAYQVSPKIEWRNGRSDRVGFIASNRVEIKIRDLKKTGPLLAAVLDAGANGVNGPDFGFQN